MADESDLSHCPWCGCGVAEWLNAEHTRVMWQCGSRMGGPQPWQSDQCRINELKAAMAADPEAYASWHYVREIADLKAKLLSVEAENAEWRDLVARDSVEIERAVIRICQLRDLLQRAVDAYVGLGEEPVCLDEGPALLSSPSPAVAVAQAERRLAEAAMLINVRFDQIGAGAFAKARVAYRMAKAAGEGGGS